MDLKDKKILFELSYNSRIPVTRLAKRIGLSREMTNYKLKKLEKSIIKKYSSQANIELLGFQRTACYITLKNCSLEEEKKLIKFLINHKFISAISTIIGKYDIIFDVFYKNNEQLQKIIMEINNLFQDKIKDLFFISMLAEQKIFYNKLFEQKIRITGEQKTKKIKKTDETDLKILKILNENARESLVNISRKTGLKANAIGYRIKELEKNNLIEQSTIFINMEKLGINIYNLQIKINKLKSQGKLMLFLRENKRVFYYYLYTGNKDWDVDVGIIKEKHDDLKNFIRELKQYFGEIINLKEIYLIDEIHKEELPEGLFSNE